MKTDVLTIQNAKNMGRPRPTFNNTTRKQYRWNLVLCVIIWELSVWHCWTCWNDHYWSTTTDQIKSIIKEKTTRLRRQKKVTFQHDNAWLYVDNCVKNIWKTLNETCYSPAISPDFAPSDYHLFRTLLKHHLHSYEEVKMYLDFKKQTVLLMQN